MNKKDVKFVKQLSEENKYYFLLCCLIKGLH